MYSLLANNSNIYGFKHSRLEIPIKGKTLMYSLNRINNMYFMACIAIRAKLLDFAGYFYTLR